MDMMAAVGLLGFVAGMYVGFFITRVRDTTRFDPGRVEMTKLQIELRIIAGDDDRIAMRGGWEIHASEITTGMMSQWLEDRNLTVMPRAMAREVKRGKK